VSSVRRGLIRSLFDVFSFGLSFFLSTIFRNYIIRLFDLRSVFYKYFGDALRNFIFGLINLVGTGLSNSTYVRNIFRDLSVPNFIVDRFLSSITFIDIFDINSLSDFIADRLCYILPDILSVLIGFLIIRIVLHVLFRLLNVFSKLPVIKFANKIGGFGIGLVRASIFLWMVCILISFLVNYPRFDFLNMALNNSKFAIKFYESNAILKFITGFLEFT
jgi:hypothetical protein